MREYLGRDWLLDTKEAQELYFEGAIPLREKEGIVDVHTHHNLRQIIENKPFPNIWRAEVLEDKEEYKTMTIILSSLPPSLMVFLNPLPGIIIFLILKNGWHWQGYFPRWRGIMFTSGCTSI